MREVSLDAPWVIMATGEDESSYEFDIKPCALDIEDVIGLFC